MEKTHWRFDRQTASTPSLQLQAEVNALADEALTLFPGRVVEQITVKRGYLQLISASPDKREYIDSLRRSLCRLADVVEAMGKGELTERLDSLIRRLQ